jgi:hypothetical protein
MTERKIKESPVVATIRGVIEKFIAPQRAFAPRRRAREAKVARTSGGRLVVLFDNGRWTVSGDIGGIVPYRREYDERLTGYTRRGRVQRIEIEDVLDALTEVRLLSKDDAKAYRRWRSETWEAKFRRDQLRDLARKAEELGARLVVSK